MSLFQSNLRKQIRTSPNILKSVRIIHYYSLLFIRVPSIWLKNQRMVRHRTFQLRPGGLGDPRREDPRRRDRLRLDQGSRQNGRQIPSKFRQKLVRNPKRKRKEHIFESCSTECVGTWESTFHFLFLDTVFLFIPDSSWIG